MRAIVVCSHQLEPRILDGLQNSWEAREVYPRIPALQPGQPAGPPAGPLREGIGAPGVARIAEKIGSERSGRQALQHRKTQQTAQACKYVGELEEPADTPRCPAWSPHDEREMDQPLMQGPLVTSQSILAHALAMVGCDHHDGVFLKAENPQVPQQLPNPVVRACQ